MQTLYWSRLTLARELMPHRFLLTLSLNQQGKVKGSVSGKSHAGTSQSRILSVYTGPVLPWFAPNGGSANDGKKIVITKQVDSASPLLLSALVNREIFTTVKFEIYGSGDGQNLGAAIGRVGLTNVVVRSIQPLGHHVKTPPQSAPVHQITLGFQTASLDLGSSAADWTREWMSGDA